MLVDLGCSVDAARTATRRSRRRAPVVYDLILLDIQMPGLEPGLGAARAIRELPEHRHTPILALTANALVDDHQDAIDATMNAYLRKPVTGAMLRRNWATGFAHSPDPGVRAAPAAGEPGADSSHGAPRRRWRMLAVGRGPPQA